MDVCECDKSREQQQADALLSSTLVIEREVQNLAVLMSHPLPLRHLREFAPKVEILSDMLRYYSGKACNYRLPCAADSRYSANVRQSFVLRSSANSRYCR